VKQWTYDEMAARLTAARFGFTEVLPMERVLEAPQARSGNKVAHVLFQDLPFDIPEIPYQTEDAQQAELPPPLLGEHTREILRSLAYDEAECDTLIASGAAVVPRPGAPLWAPVRVSDAKVDAGFA
jgi:crotonobetainyl-CoA:carnitine CoA-transferase CaiB-like acyl-CoA transferase